METVLVEGVKQLPALVLSGAFMLWIVNAFLRAVQDITAQHVASIDKLSEALRAGESCGYFRETRDGRATPRG